MSGEIVEDDDIARRQRRGELDLDIDLQDAPLHRPVDDEGSGQPITPEPGAKGLCLPVSERRLGAQTLTFQAAAAHAGHLRRCAGFIEEKSLCGSSRIGSCFATV